MLRPVTDIDTYIINGKCDVDQGDLVIDIGAHVGEFIQYAQDKNARRIIAFEPCFEPYDICRQIPGAEVHRAAIGDYDGEAMVFYNGSNTPDSSIYRTTGQPEQVKIISFAKIIDNLPEIDFLKSDCEGSERAFLPIITDPQLLKIKKMAIEWHFIDRDNDHEAMEAFKKRLRFHEYNIEVTFIDHTRSTFVAWRS